MAAGDYYFRDPEAARQAIAMMQRDAALADNASRERIAREKTASDKYATQSQISEREKDRAVSREDIASRAGVRTGAEADKIARERSNVQFDTVFGKINVTNPLTVRELEAAISANPQLTEDQKNLLRSTREQAYDAAKVNAETGTMLSDNYQKELNDWAKANPKLPPDKILERIRADKNVLFDSSTGAVISRHRNPRVDAELSLKTRAISPAQDYGGALSIPPSRSQMMGAAGSGVRTIDDVQAQIGGGLLAAAPVAGGAFPTAQQMQAVSRPPAPRVSDFATPAFYGPPNNMGVFNMLPPAQPQPSPQFRAYDLQTLRPQYAPPVDDYYYAPQ